MRVYMYVFLFADTHPHLYLLHVQLYKYIENHAIRLILAIPVQHHNVGSGFLSTIGCKWVTIVAIITFVFIWSFVQYVTNSHCCGNLQALLLWRYPLHPIGTPTAHTKQLLQSLVHTDVQLMLFSLLTLSRAEWIPSTPRLDSNTSRWAFPTILHSKMSS